MLPIEKAIVPSKVVKLFFLKFFGSSDKNIKIEKFNYLAERCIDILPLITLKKYPILPKVKAEVSFINHSKG